jgi:hypothetical protein
MQDSELKKLLLETHPVRPGQEERAWAALRERLHVSRQWEWLYFPFNWRMMVGTGAAAFLFLAVLNFFGVTASSVPFASAVSQSPGIYATAFYSKSAHAQVVWLNGMDPATDAPTYLDPTSAIDATSNSGAGTSDSL